MSRSQQPCQTGGGLASTLAILLMVVLLDVLFRQRSLSRRRGRSTSAKRAMEQAPTRNGGHRRRRPEPTNRWHAVALNSPIAHSDPRCSFQTVERIKHHRHDAIVD
jgi:hypothetical protein